MAYAKGYKFTVTDKDLLLHEWLNLQTKLSFSVCVALHEYIDKHGLLDTLGVKRATPEQRALLQTVTSEQSEPVVVESAKSNTTTSTANQAQPAKVVAPASTANQAQPAKVVAPASTANQAQPAKTATPAVNQAQSAKTVNQAPSVPSVPSANSTDDVKGREAAMNAHNNALNSLLN